MPAPSGAGRGICTTTPYFNLNSRALHRQGHDLEKPLFVLSNGLLHPNDAGYEAYAAAIVDTLRPLVDKKVVPGLQPPTGLGRMLALLGVISLVGSPPTEPPPPGSRVLRIRDRPQRRYRSPPPP